MRKVITGNESGLQAAPSTTKAPLDLGRLATVEVSSEAGEYPVETVFQPNNAVGWRASRPGFQTIRVTFDQPARVSRILLRFEESELTRTQEFLLREQNSRGEWREIVRQQWNFSPTGSTTEVENLEVNLQDVAALELQIKPEIGEGNVVASLRQWLVY